MPPLIGLTAGAWPACILPLSYARCVERAGGMPAVLAPSADVLAAKWVDRLDGLVLTGGVDVDPAHFGEEPLPALGRIDPDRDAFELSLARAALAADLPLLAVCRGIQVLNVAGGGSLIQDIPSQVKGAIQHAQKAPRWYATHGVTIAPGSRVAAMLGTTQLRVNSFHHQSIKEVARGFVVTAEAEDGIIEAVESTGHSFVVGVQWHPEEMCERDPVCLGLFRGLVEVAQVRCGR